MESLQNIKDVFSILHDGGIVSFEGSHENILLTIECQYLAERINAGFKNFYVELIGIKALEFEICQTQ